jgi:hypothetical protein
VGILKGIPDKWDADRKSICVARTIQGKSPDIRFIFDIVAKSRNFVCYLRLKPVFSLSQTLLRPAIILLVLWCPFTIIDLTVLSKSDSRLANMP